MHKLLEKLLDEFENEHNKHGDGDEYESWKDALLEKYEIKLVRKDIERQHKLLDLALASLK